jgi:prevent-host-death family protein
MNNVSISELRANLLQYLTRVQQGEQIDVTSKGVVLATLVPPPAERDAARARLATLAETARIHDVLAPIDAEWEATR